MTPGRIRATVMLRSATTVIFRTIILGALLTEADNGFNHSLAFTLENFHEPIRIKPRNRRVTQGACLACHAEIVHQMLPDDSEGEMLSCVHCHSDVGHALR